MPLVETADSAAHAAALYDTLERTVAPLYYRNRDRFTDVMRYAIALNGSFFTAQRMLQEYVVKAYGTDAVREPAAALPRDAVPA
jgi:starch phosphorylase